MVVRHRRQLSGPTGCITDHPRRLWCAAGITTRRKGRNPVCRQDQAPCLVDDVAVHLVRSTQEALLARGAVDGQILRVIFKGPGNVVLEVDDPVPVDGSPVVKIAKVIGLGSFTDIEDVVQGIAQAIGLDESPSGVEIIGRLQDRGETSIRDLLLEIVPELSEVDR